MKAPKPRRGFKVLMGIGISALIALSGILVAPAAFADTPVVCNSDGSSITQTNRAADLSSTTVTLKEGFTSCDVSLNSYDVGGPGFATANPQVPRDHQTVHLTADSPTATLTVTQGSCWVQNDLYIGTTKFDGVDGALPHFPDSWTPTNLVDWWNGGHACPGVATAEITKSTETCNSAATVAEGAISNADWTAIVYSGSGYTAVATAKSGFAFTVASPGGGALER